MDKRLLEVSSETNRYTVLDMIVSVFLFLFISCPNYFRISGIYVSNYLIVLFACIYIGAGLLSGRKFLIYKNDFILLLFGSLLVYAIPVLYHLEVINYILFILRWGILILVLMDYMRDLHRADRVITVLIYTGVILAVTGLVEIVFKWNVFSLLQNYEMYNDAGFDIRLGIPRMEMCFGHPISCALFLGCVIALCFYRYYVSKKSSCIIMLALFNICLILTMSRFPIMTVIFMEVILYGFIPKRKKRSIKRYLLLGMLAFCGVYLYDSEIREWMKQIYYMILAVFEPKYNNYIIGNFGKNLNAVGVRWDINLRVLRMIRENLFWGVGEVGRSKHVKTNSIDNFYLILWYTYGLIGFCARSLFIMGGVVKTVLLTVRKRTYFLICMALFYITYLINLMAVDILSEERVILIFFSLLLSYRLFDNERPSNFAESGRDNETIPY